jgi:hypothetical protein
MHQNRLRPGVHKVMPEDVSSHPLGQGEDVVVVIDQLLAYEIGLLADHSGDVGVSL